jgi:hypothetical protein
MPKRDGTSSTGVRERRIDMSNVDSQQTILSILQGLNDLGGLKRLFWQELNYEREIDERVYKLYGLTAEEIAIVDPAFVPMSGTTAGKGDERK